MIEIVEPSPDGIFQKGLEKVLKGNLWTECFLFFIVQLKHIFRSNDEQSGIVLQAVAGQQYFIRVDIAAGFMKGHGRLTLMDSQQGTYELTSDKLKPLDASKVVDKDRVVIEVAHPQAPSPMVPSTIVIPTSMPIATPGTAASTTNDLAPASAPSLHG